MLYHYTFRPEVGGVARDDLFQPLQQLTRYGYLGVELFFVISGFVIVMTARERTVRAFAVHRALRLYPSFWVAVVLTAAVVAVLDPADPVPLRDLLLNLSMVPGYVGAEMVDGVYWTLAVEIKFYVLVAVLIGTGLIRQYERVTYVWILTLAAVALGIAPGPVASLAIFPHGAFFAAGILLYAVRANGWTIARSAALIGAVVLAQDAAARDLEGFIPNVRSIDDPIVRGLAVTTVLAMAAAVMRKAPTDGPRWWSRVGELTYPLYLVHNRAGRLIFRRIAELGSPSMALAGALAASLAAAWLLVVGVERRLVGRIVRIDAVRRIANERRPPAADAALRA
jgi:peptidoglycan/LPS O-acetylase OafA/YrhL